MIYCCLWFSLLTASCFCKVTVETGRRSKDSSLSVACLCIHMSHLYGLEVLTCKNKHYNREGLQVRVLQQSLFCWHQMQELTVGKHTDTLNAIFPEGCSMTSYSGLRKNIYFCKILQNKAVVCRVPVSPPPPPPPRGSVRKLSSSLAFVSSIWKLQTICVALSPSYKSCERGFECRVPSPSPALAAQFGPLNWPQWQSHSHGLGWIQPSASVPQFPVSQGK